jgi:DNA polymerase-3 subunit alpha
MANMAHATVRFTPLRVHSHFSFLTGLNGPEELAAHAAASGLTHLALTDLDVLCGCVAFTRACRRAEITPMVGMTVRLPGNDAAPNEAVLLATGAIGYRSLCRISSHVQTHAQTSPRSGVEWDVLRANRDGVICLGGGRRSQLERALRQDDHANAARATSRLAGIFGEDFYLALEVHTAADHPVADAVQTLAARFGLGVVALPPIYCLQPAQHARMRLLAAIELNCRLDEVPPARLPDCGEADILLHWPDVAAFSERYAPYPAAIAATHEIAACCQDALPDGRPIWPLPALPADQDADQHLAALAVAGLTDRSHDGLISAPAHQRLLRELAAITRHGFAPLFLVVADLVGFARDQRIPVSTRGSVANSLVAYAIGITTVDPMAHKLLFERFLNPARTSLPDIDLDFCSRRRDEVLDYVRTTYGIDQVALVATVSTLQPRSALRETAKAYGIEERQVTELLKRLPGRWHPDPQRRQKLDPEAYVAAVAEPDLRTMLRAAFSIVGLPHHLSIHPGGVVITPGPLNDYVPVQMAPKGFLTTQYEHGDVEALGLPKIDLLGIRALTVLADAAALVRRDHVRDFALETIPLDDDLTGNILATAATVGVFQCESTGAQRTLRQLQARTVPDLAVANAFFKPGPATGGMAGAFVRRYRGEEVVDFLHPALEPVLAETKGVLLFQEQILQIAVDVAGLSWNDADHLRQGMSKFLPQEMERIRARFISGCLRPAPDGPAFSRDQADTLWNQIAAFAGYGFNKGHATAYADVSYRSAYIKAHWPAEFLCARLADRGGFHHPAIYIAEAQKLGIGVRPPHVNHSRRKFSLAREGEQATLWMGLGQVRSLRRSAVRALVEARSTGPFTALGDLLRRVDLQRREIENLIRCGALDGLGESRVALLAEADEQRQSNGQLAFDFGPPALQAESVGERLHWEQQVLGWPVSASPLDAIDPNQRKVRLADAQEQPGKLVTLWGVRLPGWTGGKGFFFSDGTTYVVAEGGRKRKAPSSWTPIQLSGRWLNNGWRGGRFLIDSDHTPC